MQVALKQARAQTDEQQGTEHHDEGKRVAAQGNGKQQIAEKHDDDADGDHLAEAKPVGQQTAYKRKKVDEHEEVTVNLAGPPGIKTEIGTEEKGEHGYHGVVAETLAGVGQCQRVESFRLILKHSFGLVGYYFYLGDLF